MTTLIQVIFILPLNQQAYPCIYSLVKFEMQYLYVKYFYKVVLLKDLFFLSTSRSTFSHLK